MSEFLRQKVSQQRPPSHFPLQLPCQHEGSKEPVDQGVQRHPVAKLQLDSFSLGHSIGSTVANVQAKRCEEGKNKRCTLKSGGDGREMSSAIFEGHSDDDRVADEKISSMFERSTRGEVDSSVEATPHWDEVHTGHGLSCRRDETEENQIVEEVMLARPHPSSESRRRRGIDNISRNLYKGDTSGSCGSRGDVSTLDGDDRDTLGHRDVIRATSEHVGSDGEDERCISMGTPRTRTREEDPCSCSAAAVQNFHYATQKDLLVRTSRRLMYTISDMVLSPTVSYDGFEDVESAMGLPTAGTKSDGGCDDYGTAVPSPTQKNVGGAAGSLGALQPPRATASFMNAPLTLAPLDGMLLPCSSASLASPAPWVDTSLSPACTAYSHADPRDTLVPEECQDTVISQEAHRRTPPLPPMSLSSSPLIERVALDTSVVLPETAETLRRNGEGAGGTAAAAYGDDLAGNRTAALFLVRSQREYLQVGDENSMGSRRTRSPAFFLAHQMATLDDAESDWARGALTEDCPVHPRHSQVGARDTGSSEASHGGGAMSNKATAVAPAAPMSSSTEPPSLENRCADNCVYTEAPKRHCIRAPLLTATRGPLASPTVVEQLCDGVEGADPHRTSCVARTAPLSFGDALPTAVETNMLSSQSTSLSPTQGEAFVPHHHNLMIPINEVGSGCRVRGKSRGSRQFTGISVPLISESSVLQGVSSAPLVGHDSASVTAVSVRSLAEPSVAQSRTSSASFRKKPPPRMLCPPTPSPSPLRAAAMDVSNTAVPNIDETREADACLLKQSLLSGTTPGAASESQPPVSNTNAPMELFPQKLSQMNVTGETADTAPPQAATATAGLSTCPPDQASLQFPSSAPMVPEGASEPVAGLLTATAETPDVDGGAGMANTGFFPSFHARSLEAKDDVGTGRPGETTNEGGAVTASQAATNTSTFMGDADGRPQVSSQCESDGSTESQLHYSDHSLISPLCHTASVPQHVSAHNSSPARFLCATSFPHDRMSAEQGSPSLLPCDYRGDTFTPHHVGTSALDSIRAEITVLPSSSSSPSPIRPSTSSASDSKLPHYEFHSPHTLGDSGDSGVCHGDYSNESDQDNEAHLRYDERTFSHVESEATFAVDSTRQSSMRGDLCDGGGAVVGQVSVEGALSGAAGKGAVLRLDLSSPAKGAMETKAQAQAWEQEVVELRALVKQLRLDLAAAQAAGGRVADITRVDIEVQTCACTDLVDGIDATMLMSPSSSPLDALRVTTCSDREGEILTEGSVWRRRHDSLARDMTILKSSMAEQLAVLDRLGMRPPFSEELVSAAERRLRRVKIAHGPGTAVKAYRPHATSPDLSQAPAQKTDIDNNNSIRCLVGSASATVTAKRLDERDGNTIAALLRRRKQNANHRQPGGMGATVMNTTVLVTAPGTLLQTGNFNCCQHPLSPVNGKENRPMV